MSGSIARLGIVIGMAAICGAGAQETVDLPAPLAAGDFAGHFAAVKPAPEEWRWREEIPWVGTIHEARARAAREDKPILAWQSADSPPLGST